MYISACLALTGLFMPNRCSNFSSLSLPTPPISETKSHYVALVGLSIYVYQASLKLTHCFCGPSTEIKGMNQNALNSILIFIFLVFKLFYFIFILLWF